MYNESKEIREAIQAGERALHSLYEAKTKLKKATDGCFYGCFFSKFSFLIYLHLKEGYPCTVLSVVERVLHL